MGGCHDEIIINTQQAAAGVPKKTCSRIRWDACDHFCERIAKIYVCPHG